MESSAKNDDLRIGQASTHLLADLVNSVQKVLHKRPRQNEQSRLFHTTIRQRDADYIIKLIDPFQSEPQLLDPKLKLIVPELAQACLAHLSKQANPTKERSNGSFNALSSILYTLCKVRGRKVITRFLNNEPRYLELILRKLESSQQDAIEWQAGYILLIWLAHLLLTPFDLSSISSREEQYELPEELQIAASVPSIARRISSLCIRYIGLASITREAAVATLIRLILRPDIQKHHLADNFVQYAICEIKPGGEVDNKQSHAQYGWLQLLSGVAQSADLYTLFSRIYEACKSLIDDDSSVIQDVIAQKLVVKLFRNLTVTSLRYANRGGQSAQFLEDSTVVENTVDFLIRSLSHRETIVRYAAAKALSMIVSTMDRQMGQEVIQAVLDALRAETPREVEGSHSPTANPFAWHGLTLCLAYMLFNRSIALEQIADTTKFLFAALNFEQRTATGSVLGTSARDAANFGLWSLSRRFTTQELLKIDTTIAPDDKAGNNVNILQQLAVRLVQSACLDPVGNIRRGSSAALQELVGRHPDQIAQGIALIQVVDYQAVGLRRRAMIDVTDATAFLHDTYKEGLTVALRGWRGLQATDSPSRDAAAVALTRRFMHEHVAIRRGIMSSIIQDLQACAASELESMHGLILTMALWTEHVNTAATAEAYDIDEDLLMVSDFGTVASPICDSRALFSARAIRAELPQALMRLVTALCNAHDDQRGQGKDAVMPANLGVLVQRSLVQSDGSILTLIPPLVHDSWQLGTASIADLFVNDLVATTMSDVTKPTQYGAGRLFAIAAMLATTADPDSAAALRSGLVSACLSVHVDWRIVAMRALHVALEGGQPLTDDLYRVLRSGLEDYTIDERGDVGSLVRLEAIACARTFFEAGSEASNEVENMIEADVLRLSLDRLDRVRQQAAMCRLRLRTPGISSLVDSEIASSAYLASALEPLWSPRSLEWVRQALFEGLVSCAGSTTESLVQICRAIMVQRINQLDNEHLSSIGEMFTGLLEQKQARIVQAVLDVLAFVLQQNLLQRLADTPFKWRKLLSAVQKTHYKSTDAQRLLGAVAVYIGLAEISSIRDEVIKKLLSMLRTNPLPRVRVAVAEALFVLNADDDLLTVDWTRPSKQNAPVVADMHKRYLVEA